MACLEATVVAGLDSLGSVNFFAGPSAGLDIGELEAMEK